MHDCFQECSFCFSATNKFSRAGGKTEFLSLNHLIIISVTVLKVYLVLHSVSNERHKHVVKEGTRSLCPCVSLSLYAPVGFSKKCLSSMVPFAVTMVTPTGFSSRAALKNTGLTYKAVFPLGAAGPQCSSAAKASLWLILELVLTPCAKLLISQNIVCRSFFLEMYSHLEPVSRQIYL